MSGYTTTPNYAFRKPVVGADNDLWGGDWNLNADSLDTLLKNTNNALANYLPLAGGVMQGTVGFTDSSTVGAGSGMMPDLARWWRDATGHIAMALDTTGMLMAQRLQVAGQTTLAGMTMTGNLAATGGITTPNIAFANGDLEQPGSTAVPDLSRWVRDSAGNIAFAFSTTGDTIVNNLQVQGTLTAPGFSGGGGGAAAAPADTLDITKYGGVGDGRDDVFLGTWANGAATLTLGKYAGAVTWATSGNTLVLSGLSSITAPGFDPNVIGQYVYISATDGSGVTLTTQITGWTAENTVTVADNPSTAVTTANVVWPAFIASDVGKSIRVEGAGTAINRQAYNNGAMAWVGTIASVVASNQVTVTGSVVPNFATTATAQPTRVSWGTDNSAAYLSAQPVALAAGIKWIYHPRAAGQSKTVYCAFALAQRGTADTYYRLYSSTAINGIVNYMGWVGDPTVTGVLTDISGRLMPKRIVPQRSPPPLTASRDVVGRIHMPRVGAATAPQVVEVGDSLTKYDPTSQSDAWFPMNTFEILLQQSNPKKTFSYNNIANIGVGWSEMVDPTAGTPTWVIPGTDFYFMSSSGNNDGWRGHPLKIMSGINLGHGSGNDGSGRQPDVMLTTAALKLDRTDTPAGGAAYVHEMHMFVETLLRSMARTQALGLCDLAWQSEMVLWGGSNFHREFQLLPQVLGWSLTPATPFVLNSNTFVFSAIIDLSATNVWAATGAFVVNLSPMPGNVFIIDVDPVSTHIRYEARLWGRSIPTTVTTSGSTLTTATGATTSGTLTWTGGQNQFSYSAGGLTGNIGKCLLMPGVDISAQPQRTYLSALITDTTGIADDFWWGNPAGPVQSTFTGTVSMTIGGQMFIPADAAATVDVVMIWGANSVYRGKITGYTNANTVTLTPAPPALSGQAVQMFVGKVSVPATVTAQTSTGNTANIRLSFNKDVLSLRIGTATAHLFKGAVEHFGGRFYPRFSISGAGPVTANFSNLYTDRDVYFQPSGTPADLWGTGDNNYSGGGGGGHDPSMLAERLTRRAYEALDLCTT